MTILELAREMTSVRPRMAHVMPDDAARLCAYIEAAERLRRPSATL